MVLAPPGMHQSAAQEKLKTSLYHTWQQPPWVYGVRRVYKEPWEEKQIQFYDTMNPSGISSTRMMKVLFWNHNQAEYYAAKFMADRSDEPLYIKPQAEILYNLNQLLPDLPISRARHFIQVPEIGGPRSMILFDLLPPGETLAARLERERTVPEEQAVSIFLQLSRIIKKLHSVDIMHWDLR
ncbi:MAG: hypothetical protein GF384_01195 [Elusimicrobia bacterium]|nr:hypothetical protein [Elusimicrobiota bacterium]MBD3411649.1 hypothetical protein [Elusimicrobiota bacterium]